LKIIVLASDISLESGGLRSGTLNLCKALMAKGHDVTLLSTTPSMNKQLITDNSLDTTIDGVKTRLFYYQFKLMSNIFSCGLLRFLAHEVPKTDLIVIQSLYQCSSTFAAYIARVNSIPYVLRPHGTLDPFLFFRRRIFFKRLYVMLFEKRNFLFASAIQYSTLSEATMTASIISNTAQSIIIKEGVDLEVFNRISSISFRNLYPQLKGKEVMLFLGRLHQKKGIEIALKAFEKVARINKNLYFVIVGPGETSYVNMVKEFINRLAYSDRVLILGPVNSDIKIAALKESDLFILPSYGENFGISVVEALASGLPIIITKRVGIAEDLSDVLGVIVTECDVEEVASAIIKIISSPELRNHIKFKGPEIAQLLYSIDSMGNQMDMAYKKLVFKNSELED
jgi:glycosyltransferase involved in cell wall biosynthesis